jgi:hypothetical protein
MDKIPNEEFVGAKGHFNTAYQDRLQIDSDATYEIEGTEDGCEFLATIELDPTGAKLIHLTWCKHKPQVVSNESIHATQRRRPVKPVATQLPVDGNAEKEEEDCNSNKN